MKGVTAVDTDPVLHSVTVELADTAALIDVVKALNAAGYAVGEPVPKEGGKK